MACSRSERQGARSGTLWYQAGRLSSVHAHTFGSALRAQIGYIVVPRFSLAATIAIDYASISPTTQSSGTKHSSKNTSVNSASPVISRSGRISMPGEVMSTRK